MAPEKYKYSVRLSTIADKSSELFPIVREEEQRKKGLIVLQSVRVPYVMSQRGNLLELLKGGVLLLEGEHPLSSPSVPVIGFLLCEVHWLFQKFTPTILELCNKLKDGDLGFYLNGTDNKHFAFRE